MRFLKRILLLLIAAAVPAAALSQAYPSKPVRLIVPFPAGGPADIFGRFLAQGMSVQLGQPVVIENISGVGGILGVERAARSAPDGYTLVLITTVVRVPEVLAVHPSLPVNTLDGPNTCTCESQAPFGSRSFGLAGDG